ncbi:TetR/AcrR family transcriptional regulator C-terminal domain-containing protein [Kitasatospora paracochleata]|uniref:AcrR family transcriptional regulator n=1 Tax=Kitasatospora paracochleata TaxID=58354 RepID=A0ABT1J680_9ACTN|nr:TetR/AcrR family transcriptional regulator C-terminal domain-containing protein [Kitasatospora paracochleata]MCP2312739.1 AcrR family transcriptional regulator [Kitasatospora paracochleata]
MAQETGAARRTPLNRERVLRAAVDLADRVGIEALSMRGLAQDLGVVPMALYKHVANKEQLLDGMVDVLVGEIDPPADGPDWKSAVRRRVLSARRALLGHPWASRVIETRTSPTPGVLAYLDSVIGMFRAGGLSADLTHHAMHALGSRIWGFTQELFPAPPATAADTSDTSEQAAALAALAAHYPHIAEIAAGRPHDGDSVVGAGCDDAFEFEFALDLLLDGVERLHQRGWTSVDRPQEERTW